MGQSGKRVSIIASSGLVANLWSAAFEDDQDYDVVSVATSLGSDISKLAQSDLVLVNVLERVEQGLQWVAEIRRRIPDSRIIVLGIPREEHIVLAYIEAGAAGFAPEDSSIEETRKVMRAVSRDQAILDPSITPALVSRLHSLQNSYHEPDTTGRRLKSLTPREQEVLELVSKKLTNREIANSLTIEIGTVKNHVHSILDKLEFSSRYEAAAYYHTASRSQKSSGSGST